jgi:hypothetical protein
MSLLSIATAASAATPVGVAGMYGGQALWQSDVQGQEQVDYFPDPVNKYQFFTGSGPYQAQASTTLYGAAASIQIRADTANGNLAVHGLAQSTVSSPTNIYFGDAEADFDLYAFDTFTIQGPSNQYNQFNVTLNLNGSAVASPNYYGHSGGDAYGYLQLMENMRYLGQAGSFAQVGDCAFNYSQGNYCGVEAQLPLYWDQSSPTSVSTTLYLASGSTVQLGLALLAREGAYVGIGSGAAFGAFDASNTGWFTLTPISDGASFTTASGLTYAASPEGGPGVPEPATWAMMLVGLFGVGALMRRKRGVSGERTSRLGAKMRRRATVLAGAISLLSIATVASAATPVGVAGMYGGGAFWETNGQPEQVDYFPNPVSGYQFFTGSGPFQAQASTTFQGVTASVQVRADAANGNLAVHGVAQSAVSSPTYVSIGEGDTAFDLYAFDTFTIQGAPGHLNQFNVTLSLNGSAVASPINGASAGIAYGGLQLLENENYLGQAGSFADVGGCAFYFQGNPCGVATQLPLRWDQSQPTSVSTTLSLASGSTVQLGLYLWAREAAYLEDGSGVESAAFDASNTGWFTLTPITDGASFTTASGLTYAASPEGGPGVPEPATWAMMLIGFGGLGAMIRRQRGAHMSVPVEIGQG